MKAVRTGELSGDELLFVAQSLVAEFKTLYPDWNTEIARRELAEDPGQGLPLHLIAVDEDKIVGVASIIDDDEVTDWMNHGWWLANVLVFPEHRGRGVGKFLVNQAIAIAKSGGASELHLVTDAAQVWYENQGWQQFGPADVHGHQMTLMHLALDL